MTMDKTEQKRKQRKRSWEERKRERKGQRKKNINNRSGTKPPLCQQATLHVRMVKTYPFRKARAKLSNSLVFVDECSFYETSLARPYYEVGYLF